MIPCLPRVLTWYDVVAYQVTGIIPRYLVYIICLAWLAWQAVFYYYLIINIEKIQL